jgi:hypothetical protein
MTLSRRGSIVSVGFEVLTAVAVKNSIFWDITLCSLLKDNRRFRGTFRLNLQGRRINQTRNQLETGNQQNVASIIWIKEGLFFDPEDGSDMYL